MSEPRVEPPAQATSWIAEWRTPLVLIALTTVSTLWAGALMEGLDPTARALDVIAGWDFALPLMAILLAHELGHYVVGRLHRIDISPPYFIPMYPEWFLLGTMGAVIRMRGAIRDRNALLDVGAAGPIAGMVVALPVLVYGIATSPVEPLPVGTTVLFEGRSILYVALLYALKGPIPEGHDIMLSSTAFAGWAGLLVTMMNLLPFGQLDGGHVAYALLGRTQDRIARVVLAALPIVAIVTGIAYGVPAYQAGASGEVLLSAFAAGASWLVWFLVLALMSRLSGIDHPPFQGGTLSPARRAVAIGCLVLFVLLFMPSWLRLG